MRSRLKDLWGLCREYGPAVLKGLAMGVVIIPFEIWLMDIVFGLDSWLYLLVPVGVLAIIYPIVYICTYHRKYPL